MRPAISSTGTKLPEGLVEVPVGWGVGVSAPARVRLEAGWAAVSVVVGHRVATGHWAAVAVQVVAWVRRWAQLAAGLAAMAEEATWVVAWLCAPLEGCGRSCGRDSQEWSQCNP